VLSYSLLVSPTNRLYSDVSKEFYFGVLHPVARILSRLIEKPIFCERRFLLLTLYLKKTKLNSVTWVRERTIPSERPPLVGEVRGNFCGYRVPRSQRDGSLRPCSRLSRQEPRPFFFFQIAPQLYSWGWVGLVPDPLLLRKSGSAGNRTRTLGSVVRNSDY
jgi:hypothetical protein